MEDFKFQFEKLDAWQEARKLVRNVYLLLEKFPKNENYALCDQMRRAAISVPSNIAEGTNSFSRDCIWFINGGLLPITDCP